MPKELLIKIFADHMYASLTLLILVHLGGAFIYLQLGFQILGIKINLSKIWYGILIWGLFTLSGKQILPGISYGLVLLVFITILLKILSKTSWIKSFWSAVLILLTASVGVLVIAEPLCSINKNIAAFIMNTPWGSAIGSLIEVLFPVLAIFILKTFKISMPLPSSKRLTLMEFMSVLVFGDVIFMLYSAFTQTLIDFKNTSKLALTMNVASQWAGAISLGILFYIILTLLRNDQLKREEEKADLLNRIEGVINDNMSSAGYIVKKCEGSVLIEIRLTTQEMEIIRLVVQGKKNAEIGEVMHLSEGTIRNYVTDILGKLGLPNREELAKYAIQRELLTLDDKKVSQL